MNTDISAGLAPASAPDDKAPFAFTLAYIGIGAGEGPNDPPIHNPYYDFNDRILPLGAAYWVAVAEHFLA